jgi:hypothetical protein
MENAKWQLCLLCNAQNTPIARKGKVGCFQGIATHSINKICLKSKVAYKHARGRATYSSSPLYSISSVDRSFLACTSSIPVNL